MNPGMRRFTQTLRHLAQQAFALACDELLARVCVLCEAELRGAQAARGLCCACVQGLRCSPGACPRCGEPGLYRAGECAQCKADPPAFSTTLVLADYAPPVDHLIHALKFRRERALARPLGLMMAEQLAAARAGGVGAGTRDGRFEPLALVPIPLAAERLAQRGFNQSQALAQALSRASGVQLATGLLRRVRHGTAQSSLTLDARRQNAQGAFVCPTACPSRVALIDDVMTTGATLRAAALALRAAGAISIINLVVARTAADHVSRRPGPP